MKSVRVTAWAFLIWALFVPCLIGLAQDKDPAEKAAKAAVTSSVAGTAVDTYVIGPSDVVTVTVWKELALSGSLLVRPDGMISMPLLGDIQASGMTPLQLSDLIALKLRKVIQDPNVSIV